MRRSRIAKSAEARVASYVLYAIIAVGLLLLVIQFVRIRVQNGELKKVNLEIGQLAAQTANYNLSIDACHDTNAIRERALDLGMQEIGEDQIRTVRLLRADEKPVEVIAANRVAQGITG